MPLIFLKLGGSLITDKTAIHQPRTDVLRRLSEEIAQVLQDSPSLKLLIGHGSGSFGHVAAATHDTRSGVVSPGEWKAFANVSHIAARLNLLVRDSLRDAGVPAITFQPSASAICEDGQLVAMATDAIELALNSGLVPLVYGDVAFDTNRGGTIISTEQIFAFLSGQLVPAKLLLAGEVDGVLDLTGKVISRLTPSNVLDFDDSLGASRGTDVTGGMAGKIDEMVNLVKRWPSLTIFIFSGLVSGRLRQALVNEEMVVGTIISRD